MSPNRQRTPSHQRQRSAVFTPQLRSSQLQTQPAVSPTPVSSRYPHLSVNFNERPSEDFLINNLPPHPSAQEMSSIFRQMLERNEQGQPSAQTRQKLHPISIQQLLETSTTSFDQQKGLGSTSERSMFPAASRLDQTTTGEAFRSSPARSHVCDGTQTPRAQRALQQQSLQSENFGRFFESSTVPKQGLTGSMGTSAANQKAGVSSMTLNNGNITRTTQPFGNLDDTAVDFLNQPSWFIDAMSTPNLSGADNQTQTQSRRSALPEDGLHRFVNPQSLVRGGDSTTIGVSYNTAVSSMRTSTPTQMADSVHMSPPRPWKTPAWQYQTKQQAQLQQRPENNNIDPALLTNQAHISSSSASNAMKPRYKQSTVLGQPNIRAPTPLNLSPPQTSPSRPSTSRNPSVPASTRSTRSTPAPSAVSNSVSGKLPPVTCVHCHENWWNESCDGGEPCQNCISSKKTCERPRCLNFAAGTCTSARCPRVHEGDARYENVVSKPKTLKRIGKKAEAKPSPMVLGFRDE
jgi:hypothetical protein